MIGKDDFNQNGQPKDDLLELFNKAEELDDYHSIDIGTAETEKAYQKVAEKAGIKTRSRQVFWKFVAAAVVIIVAIGVVYILLPRTIKVPDGKIRTINLPDGSTVTLNGGTKISYYRWFYL